MKTKTLLKKTHFQCVTNMFSIKQCWKLICVRPQCVYTYTEIFAVIWLLSCQQQLWVSKVQFLLARSVLSGLYLRGYSINLWTKVSEPKIYRLPPQNSFWSFEHWSNILLGVFCDFVITYSTQCIQSHRPSDIYILWDLFDLDNKTLLFFSIVVYWSPLLESISPVCVSDSTGIQWHWLYQSGAVDAVFSRYSCWRWMKPGQRECRLWVDPH